MLKRGAEYDSLNVIFDQVGTPTYAADLAEAIMKLLSHETFVPGIFIFPTRGCVVGTTLPKAFIA